MSESLADHATPTTTGGKFGNGSARSCGGGLKPGTATVGSRGRGRTTSSGTSPATSSTAALIDRDAVWVAKRAALELIRAVPLTTSRRAALDAFLARDRRAVEDWATWCAIAEVHGPDWRSWPTALADPAYAKRYGDGGRERLALYKQSKPFRTEPVKK